MPAKSTIAVTMIGGIILAVALSVFAMRLAYVMFHWVLQ